MENLGQISQLTESSGRFYVNHHLVILDLTSHGVEVRADCLCAIDSFLSNSQPISQFINLFLLKIHQLQVKPENSDLRIFSLPVTIYMSKQVGSRLRQIARKIRTGKFYSGIVFTNCTKKRPREPETGIKDGTRISIWSILFRPAKIGLPSIPFPCSISFSTGFSGNFVNGEQPLHLIIHCR